MYKFVTILVAFFFITFPAHAYLDPGLGTLIIQSIIGFAAVALGTVSLFWQKVKEKYNKFISFFKKKKK